MKRKLDDYFSKAVVSSKRTKTVVGAGTGLKADCTADKSLTARLPSSNHAKPSTSDCIEEILSSPPGLSLVRTFVTPEEEQFILDFLDAQPWRTDLSRRTMHFGGTYCLMPPKSQAKSSSNASEVIQAPPIPPQLDFIIDRLVEHGLYNDNARPAYIIVNEYRSKHGISAHIENFKFGEPVCSLTLAGADAMRFHELEYAFDGSVRSGKAAKAPKTGRKVDVQMDRGSLIVLRGPSRSSWQHEIVRGRVKPAGWRRVSLTFRVDK